MLEVTRELLRKKLDGADFVLGPPEIAGRGHISTNAAFILAEHGKTNPMDAAKELKSYLEEQAPQGFFSEIEIAEPGFLNLRFSPQAIQKEFTEVVEAGENWGKLEKKPAGTVIVEYSQPNIAKPMHVGHLRSTIIGDALANIFQFAGCKVIRWNYLGDWGTQFGKLITAYKLWGDDKEIERNPVGALNDLYVKFHEEVEDNPSLDESAREEFKKLEEGDKENKKLWTRFKKDSLKEFEEVYEILGIKFDEWKGESFFEKDLAPLTERLVHDKIAVKSEGALVVNLDNEGLPVALIRKSDGATLYLTRDIANLQYRVKEYKPSLILYVVDNGQSLHFQQLFAIADKIGVKVEAVVHVKFGLMLSEDMKRLSTRAGLHISLTDVINEAIKRAGDIVHEKQPELSGTEKERIAKVVGVGALKYNDLSQNRQSDIAFNWDKMLSFEGNSGPYLQYTYARLRSILRKADKVGDFDPAPLVDEASLDIMLKLAMYPEAIRAVTENYFPHYLANYLYDLARAMNSYYEKEPVLKAEPALRDARIHLVQAVSDVLRTGLSLLGIGVVEKM